MMTIWRLHTDKELIPSIKRWLQGTWNAIPAKCCGLISKQKNDRIRDPGDQPLWEK